MSICTEKSAAADKIFKGTFLHRVPLVTTSECCDRNFGKIIPYYLVPRIILFRKSRLS